MNGLTVFYLQAVIVLSVDFGNIFGNKANKT
jgi:hypothetical protein